MRALRPRRSRARVANAFPMACATSGVSWSPTVPRMSYSRKMAAGSVMEPARGSATGDGRPGGEGRGIRRHRRLGSQGGGAGAGEIEQAVGADAEEQEAGHRRRDDGAAEPAEPHA